MTPECKSNKVCRELNEKANCSSIKDIGNWLADIFDWKNGYRDLGRISMEGGEYSKDISTKELDKLINKLPEDQASFANNYAKGINIGSNIPQGANKFELIVHSIFNTILNGIDYLVDGKKPNKTRKP